MKNAIKNALLLTLTVTWLAAAAFAQANGVAGTTTLDYYDQAWQGLWDSNWSTTRALQTPLAASVGTVLGPVLLAPGQLNPGDALVSPNGRFELYMESWSGNLAVYDLNAGTVVSEWWITTSTPGAYLAMQSDGNAVLDDNGSALWSSKTGGQAIDNDVGYITIQDDGNVQVGRIGPMMSATCTESPSYQTQAYYLPNTGCGVTTSSGSVVTSGYGTNAVDLFFRPLPGSPTQQTAATTSSAYTSSMYTFRMWETLQATTTRSITGTITRTS